ncbi:MAG: ribosome biogenesis factor YjgA [Betaproteobacteria bacterium]
MTAELPDTNAGARADERPSKSQRKRDMLALQDLGVALVRLAAEQVRRLDLPENLRQAVLDAQKITAHEGRRRQIQYVGKLMRQVDAEPIQAQLDAINGESKAAVALMHRCERWRDRLLDDDGALTELLAERPLVDVQALRATIRAARRERSAGQPPRHARELYRLLYDHLSAAA